MTSDEWVARTMKRLSRSTFRSSFTLNAHDAEYARCCGRTTIERHAYEMLTQRVGAAQPYKDGKQTPWHGHPVFTAQHATACCCRGCIEQWHHIPRGRELSVQEIDCLSRLVMAWIDRDLARHPAVDTNGSGWALPAGQTTHSAGSSHCPAHHTRDDTGFIQGTLL